MVRLSQPSHECLRPGIAVIRKRRDCLAKAGIGLPARRDEQRIQRLNEPSKELRAWLCERLQLPRIDGISDVLDFKIAGNLTIIEAGVRTFRLTIQDRFRGTVAIHLVEISAAFPTAVFLLESEGTGFIRKVVLRGGHWFQDVRSDDPGIQTTSAGILDIFAPYRAEHEARLTFGSLWKRWLDLTEASLQQLKSNSNSGPQSAKPRKRGPHTGAKLRVICLRKPPVKT